MLWGGGFFTQKIKCRAYMGGADASNLNGDARGGAPRQGVEGEEPRGSRGRDLRKLRPGGGTRAGRGDEASARKVVPLTRPARLQRARGRVCSVSNCYVSPGSRRGTPRALRDGAIPEIKGL